MTILTFSQSHTVQAGNEFNLTAANPQAIARLRAAGYFMPRTTRPVAQLYAKRPAQFDAATGDATMTPTAVTGDMRQFAGVAYSGGPVPYGFGTVVVIDLATLVANAPLPLLNSHDHGAIIGKVASITNDGRQLGDAGKLFTDIDPLALGIVQRADRGTPFQQSVGIYDYAEEMIPAGHSIDINGRTLQGPITVFRGGTVREISLCPLGADANTTAAFFNANQTAPNHAGTFTARTPLSIREIYRRSN
jgi:hypothetical protein